MTAFYIYRYFNKHNEVIYVGLTARPLKRRVKEHSIELLQTETDHIDFATVTSEADMRMYELYYINKYQPQYNKRDLYKDGHSIELPELIFQPYLEQLSRCDYHPDHTKRDYTFSCKGGQVILSILDPYSKTPDKATITVTGQPELSKASMQDFIKLAFEVYDDLQKQE